MIQHNKSTLIKWRKIVEEFNRSKLGPGEFCRKNKVNENTLYTWRRRFNGHQPQYNTPSFLEVSLKESPQKELTSSCSSGGIQIVFNDRFKIAIEDDFNESVLLKVINVLGKAVC